MNSLDVFPEPSFPIPDRAPISLAFCRRTEQTCEAKMKFWLSFVTILVGLHDRLTIDQFPTLYRKGGIRDDFGQCWLSEMWAFAAFG
jgi:hypothetical protein